MGDFYGEVRNNLLFLQVFGRRLIPVAARSKAWVCARLLAGVAGSNQAAGWISLSLSLSLSLLRVLCLVRQRGLCVELISRAEESYQAWCV
jgi:hypothetical protein